MTVSYPVYFTSDVPNYKQMCQDMITGYIIMKQMKG